MTLSRIHGARQDIDIPVIIDPNDCSLGVPRILRKTLGGIVIPQVGGSRLNPCADPYSDIFALLPKLTFFLFKFFIADKA